MTATRPYINGVELLAKSVRRKMHRCSVHYSVGHYQQMKGGQVVRVGVGARIYAAKPTGRLPAELFPINDTDSRIDYFESDRSPIYWEGTPEFAAVVAAM